MIPLKQLQPAKMDAETFHPFEHLHLRKGRVRKIHRIFITTVKTNYKSNDAVWLHRRRNCKSSYFS